jgi:hypothetical protein
MSFSTVNSKVKLPSLVAMKLAIAEPASSSSTPAVSADQLNETKFVPVLLVPSSTTVSLHETVRFPPALASGGVLGPQPQKHATTQVARTLTNMKGRNIVLS